MRLNQKTKFQVAVCQIDSQNDKDKNLADAGNMVHEAAHMGADLVVFPENMNFMGKGYRYQAETIPGPTTDFLAGLAREYGIWLLTGSIPETCKDRPYNSMALIDPSGNISCKYSKLHLFDVDLDDGNSYRESLTASQGSDIVLCDTELGRLGFSICYDLRFGELYRLLALAGAKVIFVPACFAMQTGQAHWEVLLRARAIENGVYIVACNQTGKKHNMTAYGHSMVVDPWGRIVDRLGDKPGILMAEIDLSQIDHARGQIPCLENRRDDLYQLLGQVSIFDA